MTWWTSSYWYECALRISTLVLRTLCAGAERKGSWRCLEGESDVYWYFSATKTLHLALRSLTAHNALASCLIAQYLSPLSHAAQVLTKEQSIELFAEYPEAHSTICDNLLCEFDLTAEGTPVPGVEDDLSDKVKVETKNRIVQAMKQRLEERFLTLCQAARSGDADTIVMLKRQGANLDQTDYDGRSALHIASKEGSHKVVEALLQNDADKNIKDRWRQA